MNNCVPNLLISPRRDHSRKPDETRGRIVQLVGDVPRIELWAREQAPGWHALGDELDGLDIRDSVAWIAGPETKGDRRERRQIRGRPELGVPVPMYP